MGSTTILDHNGRAVRKVSISPAKTIGVRGTRLYGGFIDTGEKDASLVGQKKYTTYGEIVSNLSIVAASVRFYLNLCGGAIWTEDPADGSEQAKDYAEKLKLIREDMDTPWSRVVRRAAMFRMHGFSIQEWTAKRWSDGTIAMRDVAPRPQATIYQWHVDDETGEVTGVTQENPQNYNRIFIPRMKLIYVVDNSLNDSPEGLGILRNIADDARVLRRYEQLEGFGFAGDLRGVPIGRIPLAYLDQLVGENKITEGDRAAIIDGVKKFVENHVRGPNSGILLESATYRTEDEKEAPSNVKLFDIELLKSGATSLPEIAEAIMRKTHDIARCLGTEHLLLGQSKIGTQALEKGKAHNFGLIIKDTLNELQFVFEKDFRDVVFMLNGWNMDLRPDMKPEAVQIRDVEQITSSLRDLQQAALEEDDPAIPHVRDLLGVPRRPTFTMMADAALGRRGEEGAQDIDEQVDEEDIE